MTNCEEIFDALDKWIKRRPGLDFANYGETASYNAELRSINHDKKRAQWALKEARSLEPAQPDILLDSFRAFSGRLAWKDGKLDYSTGQYWPTEYRKAAASVLETYVSAWRQWQNSQNPQMFTYKTIADVKKANAAIGNHWFEESTMRFFNTRIETPLLKGNRFVTSDRPSEDDPKRYSVRVALPDGTIDTIGEVGAYSDLDDAIEAAKAE